MEIRHLETILAIGEEGSFTGAAERLSTVQSNVSEQVRQLEAELGTELFIRDRRGARPTDTGEVVIERARRVRREIEAMQADLSMLQALETGHASFGIVGTAARWVVPTLVADLRRRAPGIRLRVHEGASERLVAELLSGELAQAVVTEPVPDRRLVVETLLEEPLVAVASPDLDLPPGPLTLDDLSHFGLVLPPPSNPMRLEVEAAAAARGITLDVVVEVEGIRLIADLVAAGAGVSVLPLTAVPPELTELRVVAIADAPPRRLALVNAPDAYLSLADQAVRASLRELVTDVHRRPGRPVDGAGVLPASATAVTAVS